MSVKKMRYTAQEVELNKKRYPVGSNVEVYYHSPAKDDPYKVMMKGIVTAVTEGGVFVEYYDADSRRDVTHSVHPGIDRFQIVDPDVSNLISLSSIKAA